VHPEGFLLIERDEGVEEDNGGIGRGIGKGLRRGEGRGREGGVFLDGGVCECDGGFDVKGEEGHVDILAGEGKRREKKGGGKRGEGVIIKRE